MLIATFEPLAGPGKFCEVEVDSHFFRFLSNKRNLGFLPFQEF